MTRFSLLPLVVVLHVAVPAFARAAEPAPAEPFEFVGKVEGACMTFHTPFTPDNAAFVLQTGRDMLRVWDSRTLKPLSEPIRHDKVEYYRLGADHRTLMTAAKEEVRLWDVATGRLKSTTPLVGGSLRFADFSPDGSKFVTVVRDENANYVLTLWQVNAEGPAAGLWHKNGFGSAQFDPTGTMIVAATHGRGPKFRVFSADVGREVRPPIESDDFGSSIDRVHFDKTGKRLLVPTETGFVVVETTTDRTLTGQFVNDIPQRRTDEVRFTADDTKVAVTKLFYDRLQVYDAETGKLERELPIVRCQGSGGRWAVGWTDRKTKAEAVWDLNSGFKVQGLPPLAEDSAAEMSPDGSMILIETETWVTSVWRLRK